MFIQEYDSLNDIENEFPPELEELLKDKVPSFSFFKSQEEQDGDKFILCFSDKDNSPRAYFKLKKIVNNQKRSFSLVRTEKKSLHLSGACSEEINISLQPTIDVENLLKKYIASLNTKKKQVSIIINNRIQKSFTDIKQLENRVSSLVKSKKTYQDYLNSLNKTFKKQIERDFSSFKELNLNHYESLKECFSYKENIDDFKEIKKDSVFKSLKNEKLKIIALEKSKRVLGFSCLVKGVKKHSFYIYKNLSGLIPDIILLQLAVILFYENEDYHYLHPLNSTSFKKIHERSGFNSSNLYSSNL